MSRRTVALAASTAVVLAGVAVATTATAPAAPHAPSRHVLLLSVDGLHQRDLAQ